MANQEHLNLLKQGSTLWNAWREKHPEVRPDLSGADLSDATLIGANLSKTNLCTANLCKAYLLGVNLVGAYLDRANLCFVDLSNGNLCLVDLSHANLCFAYLRGANLSNAILVKADLSEANLTDANLKDANLTGTTVGYTVFGDVDLQAVKGLETIKHYGPSYISTSTLTRSNGNIPEVFLRGAGLDDAFITYARSLTNNPIEYPTCFISYCSKDQEFAQRLYADLQSKGVRCWFAPEHLKTGDRLRHCIDESIRLYDKLLLVLSEHAVASTWVEHEVETAMGKEQEGKHTVLFPLRLDQAVMDCRTGWASHIRLTRHITDFSHWKQHNDYQRSLARLLRDLKAGR